MLFPQEYNDRKEFQSPQLIPERSTFCPEPLPPMTALVSGNERVRILPEAITQLSFMKQPFKTVQRQPNQL